MSNRIVWDGLEELRAGLRALPATLTTAGGTAADAHGADAEREIRANYPATAASLSAGVTSERQDPSRFTVKLRISNTHPLAYIFEIGTAARHTQIGANRGAMRPGKAFLPVMERERARMYEDLRVVLEREGLVASGAP